MFGFDIFSQVFGILLLVLVFSVFIVFVCGYCLGGVSGVWYDLVFVFVVVWLVFWFEVGVFVCLLSLVNVLGLVLQVGVILFGCLFGYGVVRGLWWVMWEIW